MRLIILAMTICFLFIGCGSDNEPPSVPSKPYPANSDINIPIDVELSWRCKDPDGDRITFNIYLQDEFEETYFVFENHPRPVLSIKGLKYNTDYRWRVIARDEKGNITEGPTWTFTTEKYTPPIQVEKILVNETVKVEPGKYTSWRFSLTKGSKLHGEISSDSAINIWLMSKRDFDIFEKWGNFSYYAEASRKQVLQFTFDHVILENGEYYFVLDNRSSLFTSRTVSVYIKNTE